MLFSFILIGLSLGIVYGLVALGISLVYRGLDRTHLRAAMLESVTNRPYLAATMRGATAFRR